MVINKALLKYGYSNFMVDILEYCDLSDVISREQHYLDLLKPEYNILKTAYSSLGYKHTEDNLSIVRQHLAKLNKAKGFKVEIVDKVTNTVNTFDSLREAAKQLKIARETIIKYDKMRLEKGIEILIKKRYSIKIFRNMET